MLSLDAGRGQLKLASCEFQVSFEEDANRLDWLSASQLEDEPVFHAFLNQFPAAGGYDVRVGFGKFGNEAIGVGLDVDVALRPGRVVVDEDGGATVRVEEGEQEAEQQQLCVLEFDEER